MNENIKWAALQPLTGGMFFGAKDAVGHNAEFIISYPGFEAPRTNKDGKVIGGGNEYHLLTYLDKKNERPPYYQFDRKPFQTDDDLNPKIMKEGVEVSHPDYSNIDLVVAVPVCSGLSQATYGVTDEAKAERNCNMKWLARYALNVIKPKVYIFENAPTLMSNRGDGVRAELEDIAKDAGYSVLYYKTDTKWHDNCQQRPRTFILFFKENGNKKGVPISLIKYENENVSVDEFLSRIPKNATQRDVYPMGDIRQAVLSYIKHLYGDEWRSKVKNFDLISEIVATHHEDDFNKFINESDFSDSTKKKIDHYVKHIHEKQAIGKGFWHTTPTISTTKSVPAAMYKTIPSVIHYKEDRLYNMREWLSVMGMPYDFEMQGDCVNYFRQIGQNVPARTAKFITSMAVDIINNWDTVERASEKNVYFYDNTKQNSKCFRDL